jgi:hypothetical protein
MKPMYIAVALSSLLTTAAGAIRARAVSPAWEFLSGEIFKAGLTFCLVGATGALIKVLADRLLEVDRDERARTAEKEKTKRALLEEFTAIYSGFYSLRKLWHSARDARASVYGPHDSDQYSNLVRSLIERSVGLEGKYGALKIALVRHFGLQAGDYGSKSCAALQDELSKCKDPHERARLQLDFLGECYDDWRHALEEDRKIATGVSSWRTYESLLAIFDSGK